ncbi:PIN domain-containing protein [Marivirga sp.]|uniref:PIN domain-containing protein n=1 Tax=Marivirga sp. TaxID=2018662 RepID=UPI0025D4FDF9|nr:PIN domain-containing protein [Marivirga sp.]
MRIFLDANIIVSVLNKEYPLFNHSARILSLAGKSTFEFYTSPICLAIAFYFASKKVSEAKAKEKISLLCQHIKIADADQDGVEKALANKKIYDLEDGFEYYAAERMLCNVILTENKEDFYFSEIEVLNSSEFITLKV